MSSTQAPSGRPTVAVIGAGVSGLTAAYALHRTHDVTLYEAAGRLGGHADTHRVTAPEGADLAVDTGFIVHNRVTYPTLLRLFDELGVTTQPTQMSMSVWCRGCGLQYAGGTGGRGLLAQPRRLLSPAYLRMLADVPRFHRTARALLQSPDDADLSLGDLLARGRWSAHTVQHFVVPLVSAVWSCAPGDALAYPARHLFAFLDNHGMLSVRGSHPWFTVTGGSHTYVQRVAAALHAVRTGTPVRAVERHADAVTVRDAADGAARFDQVVVATHPDQALSLLADPDDLERSTLGAFRYTDNPTVLHTSTTMLPEAPAARASWNYQMPSCDSAADDVLVTYDMTRLQRLPTGTRYLVTLNPHEGTGPGRVDPATVLDRMSYRHPVFTLGSVAAQKVMPSLNRGRTAFAGAWHGWGFHEDGARAGLAAATSLGATW